MGELILVPLSSTVAWRIVSNKPSRTTDLVPFTTGSGLPVSELLCTVVPSSVFKLPSRHSTRTKRMSPSLVFFPSSVLPRLLSVRLVSYPFDTMQRRLQIEASKPAKEQIYNGMQDCFQKILKTEGPRGFFKGALANVLRGTGAAIVLVMYDEIMNFVERSA